jgi:Cytochrome c7 and related cytochrome c
MARTMMKQRLPRKLTSYFFVLMLAVLAAGCGGSGNGEQGTTASGITSPVVARIGPIVATRVGETAVLDGSKSSTAMSAPLSFNWAFSHKPHASKAELQGATTANPSFIADAKGVYMVQLIVSANGISSQRAIQTVIVSLHGERKPTGRFNHEGLSSDCVNCHNGELVDPGKSPDHIATSNLCQACHTPQGAAIIPFADHLEVFGNCSECHNGITAVGKSEFHTPTTSECDDCHNTTSFLELAPDGSFDHSNISRACSGCHNGTVAIGKTPTSADTPPGAHPITDTECGYCHTTVSFLNAYPDHTGPDVVGPGITCDSCHVADGSGPALGQIPGHPDTSNVDCESCHSITTFKMPGGIFNHSLLESTVQSCESCHNASTSINATPATDTQTHRDTTEDCGWCHNTESFADAIFDHTGVVDNCQTCHGITASGKPLATPFYAHMPTNPDNPGTTSDQDCGDCHTPGTFATGTYDHVNAAAGSCTSCHDNRISVGKLLNHIPTTPDNQECDVCHDTSSFTGATFDHTSTDTSNCLACHDGNISKGKSTGHVTTQLNCSSCHTINNGFTTFAGTFVHDTNIVGGDCASCHNTGIALPKKVNHIPAQAECSDCHSENNTTTGDFALTTFLDPAGEHEKLIGGCEGCHTSRFIANPLALKASNHLPTAQDCDVCHINSAFKPSIFTHSGITNNCESCHDGKGSNVAAGALGKAQAPNPHPATTADCGACHAIGNNFQDGTFDHTGIVNNCASCHGDNPTSAPVGPKKNSGHVVTNQDCSVCHVTGTFANATFNHTGIVNNCASCHDGSGAVATTKNNGHLPTTEDCSVCHNTTAFAGARFDHTGIVDGCATCHDGASARGKTPPPNHVPTNGDCSNCHQTTGFLPATFDHVGIVDNCSSCHDAGFATPKSANHIATAQDCSVCHNTRTFVGAVFDHTGIVNNCESCHDGSTAKGKDAAVPAHLATSLDCYHCHTTSTFVGGTWVHDASTAGQCDTCHSPGGGATAKSVDHLNTTVQCDVCHTTNGWAPTSFSHSPSGGYPGDHRRDPGCTGCHGSPIDDSLPYPHPDYAPPIRNEVYCAACHARDFERKGDHIGGENGTVEQNKNCAGSGCHRVNSSEF